MIDDRIAERRRGIRDGRRRARLRRTILVLVTVAVLATIAIIERSPLVGLEEVQVSGIERLAEEQIKDAADIPLGTSTLRLGLGDAAARVTALPLVREATATRLDPLTVHIEVVERRPALTVEGGATRVLVDRDGVVIAEGGADGLPVIELADDPPTPGSTVGDDPALANAHAAWRGLSGPLRAQVTRFDAQEPEELDLLLADGVLVRFGRADRLAEKTRALGAVLDDVGATPIAWIDVRAPSAPVVVAD